MDIMAGLLQAILVGFLLPPPLFRAMHGGRDKPLRLMIARRHVRIKPVIVMWMLLGASVASVAAYQGLPALHGVLLMGWGIIMSYGPAR